MQASVMTVREDAQLLAAAQLVAIGRGPMTAFPHSLILDPHLLVSILPVHSSLSYRVLSNVYRLCDYSTRTHTDCTRYKSSLLAR